MEIYVPNSEGLEVHLLNFSCWSGQRKMCTQRHIASLIFVSQPAPSTLPVSTSATLPSGASGSVRVKKRIFLNPFKIDFFSETIPTGLDYGDLGHFWPPRAIWGVWGAYVGFRGACKNQIFQFPHETIFGPEMSFVGPN